jgi:potassium channel
MRLLQRVVAKKWMIYPSDRRKIAWDCLSCAAVLYAVAEIPFTIGFLSDVQETFAIILTDDILVLIFGIEIFLTFNSAIVDTSTGLLITNRKEIAIQYSKFWLWIDIAAAAPIRQLAVVFYSSASVNSLDSIKLLRLLRLSRLAYVYKLLNSQRLSSYMDYINFSPQIKNMTLLFLQIFLTGHVVACFWFFITTRSCTGLENPTDDGLPILIHTWATDFGYQTMNTYGRYIGSLYWTFETLFTIGYGDIHAVNDGERVFSILIMLLGSIIFGAVIAKIKDVLDSCSIQANETIVKIEEFSEYLEEKNFPKILRVRAKVKKNPRVIFLCNVTQKSPNFQRSKWAKLIR